MIPGDEIIGPIQSNGARGADIVPLPSLEQVRQYIRASKAENTLRGYESDWRHFCVWCESHNMCPLPTNPESVASYIAECAERLKVGSIQRRLNAIAEAHKAVGLESPTHGPLVSNTMKGIRRTLGTAAKQKAPALTDDIRAMVDATGADIIGARDRALILLGFAGAFRRSELVGLDVDDCAFGKDGLTVTLRRSKTDQMGVGRKIGIPYGGILTRARFACYRFGSSRWQIRAVRCFGRSIDTGKYCRAVVRYRC
jgi:site-specific recombinase XerD